MAGDIVLDVAATLLGLYVVFVWARFVRVRFESLFVLPAACLSAIVLFQIYIAITHHQPASLVRLFGSLIMMNLLHLLLLKPGQNVLLLIVTWITLSLAGNLVLLRHHLTTQMIVFVAIAMTAELSLLRIWIFRKPLLDRPDRDIETVFD